jgi:hypothetical protein
LQQQTQSYSSPHKISAVPIAFSTVFVLHYYCADRCSQFQR